MRFQYAIRSGDPVQEQRDRELEDRLEGAVDSTDIQRIERISLVDYLALAPPDPSTLYLIV